ncbi:MAG: DUF4981 domain-containing protein, partial [Clostridiales bacterium]|nr:DUF4981 domain-containing protein [Clostridiales bacterium]
MSSFDYTRISDPAYIEENRLPAHSDHIINGGALTLYLNGLWKFHYAKNYASTVPGFWEDDYDASGWDDITVPAHIQLEGYDVPQYANVQYPWDGLEQIKPGEIPQRFNPVGSYVRSFTVPEDWRGMGLRISFQGVESAFALWVNGRYVGYGSDGFTPSDFDITDFTRDGENKLAVQVFKFSAGSWLEDQDFFRFSGIFRDVLLQAVPSAHIEDVKVETIVSEDLNEAVLRVGLNIRGEGKPRLKLMLNGVLIAENELPHSDIPVHNPKLWSAEDPVLYELLIELFNSEGQLIETVNQPVGFRRFELKGSLMCLNGQRIEFRGVNRHEFHPLRGRTLTTEDIETDLKIMKRLNINAVRTSHYPNQSVFYALCDKLGLYVIDETNLETHGIWDGIYRGERPITDAVPGDKPEWKENVLSRANAMYQRDKNHPCVLIWSCGNEAFGGSNIYEMSKLFRRLDPSRLVHYEGIANDRRYPGTSDMESRMYVPAAEAGVYLDEHRDKPYIMCEYAHAMGNSLGAVYKYTELAEREPLYQGGFIWDFADQALWAKDHYGRDYLAYGGDLGDRPTDYHFCGNGIVLADRSLTPMAQEVKYVYQAIKVIPSKSAVLVKNRNLFISTEYLDCIAILEKEGHKVTEASIEAHVPPMGELLIDLPFTIPAEPGEYCLTVSFRLREDMPWAEKGYEVAFGQYIHKNPAQAVQKIRRPLNIVEGYHNFGVTGKDFNVLFSKTHGGLTSYKFGGREFITAIPKPHFWRALLPNDKGNQMAARHGVWLLASRFAVAKSEKLERL